MDWVEPQVGGGRVSGNPLGEGTSVIQFDYVTAMAALCLPFGRVQGSTGDDE